MAFTCLKAQLINSYGFKAGLGISDQDFDYKDDIIDLDKQIRYDLNIGAFLELFDNSNLNVLLESHYAPKGINLKLTALDETGQQLGKVNFHNRVDYLEFDILGKCSLNLSSLKPYLLLGPKFDILLGYHSEKNVLDLVYNNLEPVDFGFTVGCGTELNLVKNATTLIELRYSPTLSSSYKTDKLEVRNSSFEILTGIKF